MGKKEFLFSVLASIFAAIILELSGVVALTRYLSVNIQLPVWALFLFLVAPIFISIVWFRNTKTPEHVALIEAHEKLLEDKTNLENTLTESRHHTSSLELLTNDSRREIESLRSELAEWGARGVKLWREGDILEQIVNKRFGPEIVELDGKEFVGCKFEGSILKFKGTGPVSLQHDTLSDVRWVIDRPASEAFGILGGMYASGMPEMIQLVEQTFENIKKSGSRQS